MSIRLAEESATCTGCSNACACSRRTGPGTIETKPERAAPTSFHGLALAAIGIKPTAEQIRLRAYQIFLERGAAGGDPGEDWKQAERDLGVA